MRKPAIVSAAVLLLVLIFWIGIAVNFPGEALSRVVVARLNRLPNIEARLSPASLGLISINMEELRIDLAQPGQTLIVLENVRIPFSWGLFSGLSVEAQIGKDGRLKLFIPWEEGELTINATALRLEEIPGFAALKPVTLRGGLEFSGKFQMKQNAAAGRGGQLPQGEFSARAQAVELARITVMGANLPPTRLESAVLKVKTGKRINVESFNIRGDVQGGLKGFIQPRSGAFAKSPIQLSVTVSFKDSWLRKLGAMRPLVEGFLKNGRLEANLRGSVGKPVFKLVRGGR